MSTKRSFAKIIVPLVIILNVLFTAAVLYVFFKTSSEPVTLIGCWFAFTTGELWMLASIKKEKVRKGENSDEFKAEANE